MRMLQPPFQALEAKLWELEVSAGRGCATQTLSKPVYRDSACILYTPPPRQNPEHFHNEWLALRRLQFEDAPQASFDVRA